MLRASGILTRGDLKAIERGLSRIATEIQGGTSAGRSTPRTCTINIERRLIGIVGNPGKRLHTARSRNDQVATDLRLWLARRDRRHRRARQVASEGAARSGARHAATVMPGFTHLQVAQPVTFGHHLLAYFEMLERDHARLADCRGRVNRAPARRRGRSRGPRSRSTARALARELGFRRRRRELHRRRVRS